MSTSHSAPLSALPSSTYVCGRTRAWPSSVFILTSALNWMMVVVPLRSAVPSRQFSVCYVLRETAPLSHTALGCPHYCLATRPYPPFPSQIAPPTA